MYKFGESSQPYVAKCLEAAAKNRNSSEKWLKAFTRNTTNLKVETKVQTIDISAASPPEPLQKETTREFLEDDLKTVLEMIENELQTNFSCIVVKCVQNHRLMTEIAAKITEKCAEKFCKHICTEGSMDSKFLHSYFKDFVPNYLKQPQTCFTVQMLMLTMNSFPEQFKRISLPSILQNMDVSSTIFHDFIQMLSASEADELLLAITEIKLNKELFMHNILSIHNLFKENNRNSVIQNYIFNNIQSSQDIGGSDKNFGRLLLTFLKSIDKSTFDCNILEQIVDNHQSPLKIPCLTVIKKLKM